MNITADAVKQLRERTGAGMMECKKALVETNGDLDSRRRDHAQAGSRRRPTRRPRAWPPKASWWWRGRPTASTAVMVEVNCETDFVAREHEFRGFAHARPTCALQASVADSRRCKPPAPLRRDRRGAPPALMAKIGENITVRPVRRSRAAADHLGAYVHGTRIGALVGVEGGDAELADDLAMHVARQPALPVAGRRARGGRRQGTRRS